MLKLSFKTLPNNWLQFMQNGEKMSLKVITTEEFKTTIETSDKPIIVDFYADWCGPCKMMMPLLNELASETNEVDIYKLDVDEHPSIANLFKVSSLPTMISFKDGYEVKRHLGPIAKEDILENLL